MADPSVIETLKHLLPQCLLPDQVRIGSRLARWLASRRHGSTVEGLLDRWTAEAHASIAARRARAAVLRHLDYPPELPITAQKDAIVAALRQHPVLVVAGETGSGKTTQLPKMCLEAGLGLRARIGCTQPRRVAALSISRRIAEELQVDWGRAVGAKIRFADHSSPETSIKVMTDGLLLAEIQGDPLLAEYEALILDEAHERSINIDFLLGHLHGLLRRRDDLKLIITSATIDTDAFARAFQNAPVIGVSGRRYPVEIRYQPLDERAEDDGEVTYVDAALDAVDAVLASSTEGDVLIFMPGERDIRETCDRLAPRRGGRLEVVPLFGRLTAADQQRVFQPGSARRVVVATNIAETSLTVPRIRYVIDTGLGRISRYHAATRSRRLPVEPIAQSSARQREGRCGRIGPGVCIRLYSEEDLLARPAYMEPEIQRCNLADVILRLKAFQLGDVESFPFLDPPAPAAIQAAYDLLEELGALDAQRSLTALGRDLAHLPVDPAIGRMILEAHHEGALREVLIIAAGLSIQDPRERPLDQKDAAEAAHRRFQHPQSDFLALLTIWNAYHDTWDQLRTQNQLRKFCKTHFLSYVRMREWRDLHNQLEETLHDLGGFEWNGQPADYAAIHRSILTGLWGHVGCREERNLYRVPGNRQVMVFPGSTLFAKTQRPTPAARSPRQPPAEATDLAAARSAQPPWLVAGELVVTTRPYARTVAAIEPEWILELAPHLLKTTHLEPRWDRGAERVLVTERLTLRGLVVQEHAVGYLKVDPKQATDLFIRAALVPADIDSPLGFLAHNRQLLEKLELWQTRLPHRVVPDLDGALADFYARQLTGVASVHDLNRIVKARGGDAFLRATEADLLGDHSGRYDAGAFPDAVPVGSASVPVRYAYAPGEERDGVTVRLSVPLVEAVNPADLDWAVPALREARVLHLLQDLPKMLRRPLMPLPAAAREILKAVDPSPRTFLQGMTQFVRKRWGVQIEPQMWPVAALPPHLQPRFEVVDDHARPVAAGRDLAALQQALRAQGVVGSSSAWKQAAARWERYHLTQWDCGDLPEQLVVDAAGGLPVHAFPGLHWEQGDVNLRLFHKAEEAAEATREGLPRLVERILSREMAWLAKDLRALDPLKSLYLTLGPAEELPTTALECLRRHLFCQRPLPPLQTAAIGDFVAQARAAIPNIVPPFVKTLDAILKQRQALLLHRHPLPQLAAELDALVPKQFLIQVPYERLAQLPRYLKALHMRVDRAALHPAKDTQKAHRVAPYLRATAELRALNNASPIQRAAIDRFRWLVEEFKISVFAQELGTSEPVSPKRLDAALAEARGGCSPG